MNEEELHEKALSFPTLPGVYFWRDENGSIIYIGKAVSLRNRVCQYFHATRPPKAAVMVRHARSLEYTVTKDEFEALVLESTLIKQYKPKYNILLKDDKGYPFIRIDTRLTYPKFEVVNKKQADGAQYFGPYGGRGLAYHLIDAINASLGLPTCAREFPRDTGKGRPCLHYQTGSCVGPCRADADLTMLRSLYEKALYILDSKYDELTALLQQEMEEAAEALDFERAATLRDRCKAVASLGEKQNVLTELKGDTDAFGWYSGECHSAFSVIGVHNGAVYRTRTESFQMSPGEFRKAIPDLLRQFYANDPAILPDRILLSGEIEDAALTERFFGDLRGKKTELVCSCRSVNRRLLMMAEENAKRETERVTKPEETVARSMEALQRLAGMAKPPKIIDSFDMSNFGGKDNVGASVRFYDGKPQKSGYRRFMIKSVTGQDDYRATAECVIRRYAHCSQSDPLPDLILADGGLGQVHAIQAALAQLTLNIPVLGMVKDDRHRTRALIDSEGRELALNTSPVIFRFAAAVQEEVHRFAIAYQKQKRSAGLQNSRLDRVPGVGPARKKALLKAFGSVKGIFAADRSALEGIVPPSVAEALLKAAEERRAETAVNADTEKG